MSDVLTDPLREPQGAFAGPPPVGEGVVVLMEQRWRTVLAASALGLLFGAALSLVLPPWYESTARLAVIPVEDPTATGGINPIDGTNATLPIVVAVLRSRSLADQTVAQLQLETVYHTANRDAAREVLTSHLEVSTDRKSNLITISVEDHVPARARVIAETVSRLATARSAELWAEHNHDQRRKLEAQLAEVTTLLRAAEQRRRAFREHAGIIDLPAQLRATVDEAVALEKLRIDKRVELHFAREFSAADAVEVQRVAGEHAAAARELAALRHHGDKPLLALAELPALEAEETEHKREIERLAAHSNLVALKLSQLAAADARTGGRAELVNPPSEPRHPHRPSLIGLGAQGAAGGALLAAFLILWSHRRRAARRG